MLILAELMRMVVTQVPSRITATDKKVATPRSFFLGVVLTSVGTAAPIILRLWLHSMGAHAASVNRKASSAWKVLRS